MKKLTLLFALLLAHAQAEIRFVGVMSVDGQLKIGLHDTKDQSARWLAVGESFAGFTLESYQPAEKTVVIRNAEKPQTLTLQTTPSSPAPAAPAASAESPASANEYVVKPGDTGAKIARAHDLTLAELQALNPSVNWSKLRVGDKVRIQ